MYNNNKRFNKHYVKKDNAEVKKEDTTPLHLKNIVYLIRNNAEIRHYTSLAMIQLLKKEDKNLVDKKIFIKFLDKKYAVCYDGLNFEYRYNNDIFVTALAASFPVFAATASKTINEFITEESISISNEEIDTLSNTLTEVILKAQ